MDDFDDDDEQDTRYALREPVDIKERDIPRNFTIAVKLILQGGLF